MQATANKVVAIHYTLTDNDGQVLDSSQGSEPLYYLHGHDNIIVGLEKELEGCKVGATFSVKVPPSEAYGERQEELTQPVPREAFQGVDVIEVGMQFHTQDEHGMNVVTVTEVTDTTVTVDANHPLAGIELNFTGEIIEIRDASETELEHGHCHEGHLADHEED